ncbi:MAG: hypothetical protein Q9214_003873 [Letrouitia sp. 1 TL-2023]
MLYSPAVGFTKISIILLMLRIFCPKKRDPYYWILQSLNILNTIFYAVFIFIPIFLCKPRQKAWLPDTPGSCLNVYALYIASAVFNIISDLAMYFIPLWRVWHLKISRGQKIGVSAIFATGSLAIIASIFRLVFAILFLYTLDFSPVKVRAVAFTSAKLSLGLICSCVFVLPRLYRHLTSTPPYNSEEYHLRKYKNLASQAPGVGRSELSDGVATSVKRGQE